MIVGLNARIPSVSIPTDEITFVGYQDRREGGEESSHQSEIENTRIRLLDENAEELTNENQKNLDFDNRSNTLKED